LRIYVSISGFALPETARPKTLLGLKTVVFCGLEQEGENNVLIYTHYTHTIQNDIFAFVVGRNTRSGKRQYLRVEKNSWWRGGGTRHVFTPLLREASLFTHSKASDFSEMHNEFTVERQVNKSEVLTLRIDT
jgi:hypothetical protein